MNPMQLASLIRNGSNPQQLAMSLLQQQAGSNPMLSQALKLAQQGNYSELDKLARNLCNSAGLDYDKEIAQFKQTIGM